ncbi:pyridoxamine kinase [uncultured Megasphaera sp.]|uniref:pyridoxamine kinase n=1 Tax=uncultured Megasphaera sp. TaxID=165188 RepID=UPI0026586F9C|nr:pyridoxamine kinase [uncultured Megasphaera sp.]
MTLKRVLAVHDMCSFGRCSLTAAIPVISAMGIQVNPFPTALFSNNLTYGEFTFTDFTPHMHEFMDQWEKLGFSYDAVYSGFLADAGQIAVVKDAIRRFVKSDGLVVVDPAMADDGKLYPVFQPNIVTEMKDLISKATIITPNYTEASLLLDRPYSETAPTSETLQDICVQLSSKGPKAVVITSVPSQADEIKIASYDAKSNVFDEYAVTRVPFSTCGTGDIFTSVLTGSVLNGASLGAAVKKAADFLSYAIKYTYDAGSDYREGVQLEPCLKQLL